MISIWASVVELMGGGEGGQSKGKWGGVFLFYDMVRGPHHYTDSNEVRMTPVSDDRLSRLQSGCPFRLPNGDALSWYRTTGGRGYLLFSNPRIKMKQLHTLLSLPTPCYLLPTTRSAIPKPFSTSLLPLSSSERLRL